MRIDTRSLAAVILLLALAGGCEKEDAPIPVQPGSLTDKGAEIALLRGKAHDAVKDRDAGLATLYFDELLKLAPQDREALGMVATIRLDQAARSAANQPEAAYVKLAKALDALKRLQEAHPTLTPDEKSTFSMALFFDARRLAKAKQLDDAMKQLHASADMGFESPEALTDLDDFQPLRDRPEFQEMVKSFTERANAHAREQAKQALAGNQAFPFDFELPDPDGKKTKLVDLKGKVTIVDFWGTWCAPCRMEVPHFVKLYEKYHDRGLSIVGLNNEQATDPAEATLLVKDARSNLKINYPCLMVDQQTITAVPGFTGFPTTLFLDEAGHVRARLSGAESYRNLEAIVLLLLEEAAAPGPSK